MLANSSPNSPSEIQSNNLASNGVALNGNTSLDSGAIADNSATANGQVAAAMPTAFDPHPVEAHWYPLWQQAGYFQPRQPAAGEKPFVITIPPPNVTGVLHLGHAMQHTIHDCLLRYHRMQGQPTLCVPGTDHASISTQIKVQQQLHQEEGKTRHDVGREEFVRRAWVWKNKYGSTIIQQLKSLGCSYDWSRERFTMDEAYSRAVLTVFKQWFDEGKIYRGLRLTNWSPGAQTTVSDLEIEYREVNGQIWHLRYPVQDSQEYIVVATTRPETMLGDTAVAVHPSDERYQHLIGKNVMLPLMNRLIPIVADSDVDASFGTGAVKVTPAHDPTDYDIGQRHDLPMISVIGFDAKMTGEAGAYAGLTREEARKAVVRDLQAQGLVEKIEPYTHSVGHCTRTGTVIEPLLSEQWFVAMKELARPVADALKMGRVRYMPERFVQTSLEWMENIRDWCISRQLWWGHRIPVYYGPQGEIKVSIEPITEEGWHQDEDVLDTWFSSALWPFVVLGWPDKLETEWYPTSVLITGRDILNLWVSRMILTSLHFVDDEIPFHDVLVHPTVQDCFGLRMSKSLGTGIDPMGLIDTYGADATRFGLAQLATDRQDVRFLDQAESALGEETVRSLIAKGQPLPLEWSAKPGDRYPQMQSARNFANKIWNASRFVLTNVQQPAISHQQSAVSSDFSSFILHPSSFDLPGRWILARLHSTVNTVTEALNNYQLDVAASALYQFFWGDYCDWFVELSKPKLRAGDEAQSALLVHVLETALRLLHPFMPFLSEEIWQRLPKAADAPASISIAPWPALDDSSIFAASADAAAERDFGLLQEIVGRTRNLRAEAKLPPSQKLTVTLIVLTENATRVLQENTGLITYLANLEAVSIVPADAPRPENALSTALPEVEIYLPLTGLIDVERESARLQKELDDKAKDLARVTAKLGNSQFTEKAPRAVVEKEEAKRAELSAAIEKLQERLRSLG
ncbi:MAG: valine--tRNA ligase [Abitibacteriaceae bacterium]|nr:valine--tRNA ligase [Abditibacteriaceae bacterium]